ncbi:MAG: Ig-like domain-containing protein [bacterium]|nr:Ig-like domain-containing protein [bacterium]
MKMDFKRQMNIISTASKFAFIMLFLGACSGGSSGGVTGGIGGASGPTTKISGKVSLSSAATGGVLSKPVFYKADGLLMAPKGKPGSTSYNKSVEEISPLWKVLYETGIKTKGGIADGMVYLYDAKHPEWLCPVASAETDSTGSYTLSVLKNASCNGDAYVDGNLIPASNYTLLAYKPAGYDPVNTIMTDDLIAIQSVIKRYAGDVSGVDLVAQESDATPAVRAMFGISKNRDGTQTWGGSNVTGVDTNVAIQITFNMAISRSSIENAITIDPAVSGGHWAISADWLSATYYYGSEKLKPNTTYTVTVYGEDTSDTPIKNVYGNPLPNTSIGSFTTSPDVVTADFAPTVRIKDPINPIDVEVTSPIRIESNKPLDINGLLLASEPSMGTQPGVIYVGKDDTASSQFKYVYEFVLGSPLKLDTSYTINVSGGKDLAGRLMNEEYHSFKTRNAATSSGINASASTFIQTVQAEVLATFGRWIRAMDDRDMAQLQSVTAGDFFMEYDVSQDYDPDDINRDGRLSSREFASMMDNAFLFWDGCDTTITGDILPGKYVNVGIYQSDASGVVVFKSISSLDGVNEEDLVANFAFTIGGSSAKTDQECVDSAPKDTLYVTARKINDVWMIFRASIGIDTSAKEGSFHELFTSRMLENDTVIPSGGELSAIPNQHTIAKFQWTMSGPSSYVLIVMDERNPNNGFALAIPVKESQMTYEVTTRQFLEDAKDVGKLFGLKRVNEFRFDEGGKYKWEVLGFGTIPASGFENAVKTEVMRDIVAVSSIKRFSIDGFYKELNVVVRADTNPLDTNDSKVPLAYSEYLWGYNAYNASSVVLEITAPNANSTNGLIYTSGHTDNSYNIGFGCVDFKLSRACGMGIDASGELPEIPLLSGWNLMGVYDNTGLFKNFRMWSDDGIAPLIGDISVSIVDPVTAGINGDEWNFFSAGPGQTVNSVKVSGFINATTIDKVHLNLWNDDLMAFGNYSATVLSNGSFLVDNVTTYGGDNWINVEGSDNSGANHRIALGVHADSGSAWVAPFSNVAVGESIQTATYMSSTEWEVDTSVDDDDIVTITGNIKTASGTYEISSRGGYKSGSIDGSGGIFTLDVTLYNGWNYITLRDAEGNFYGVNILTENGLKILGIKIINGQLYDKSGSFSTDQCQLTIEGGAPPGNVYFYWNGYNGMNWYYESRTAVVDPDGNFSVTMPVVGNYPGYTGSYNYFDLSDSKGNYRSLNVTTSGSCTYTPPVMSITGVEDPFGTLLPKPSYEYDAGGNDTITVKGTSSDPGRTITASMWLCGSSKIYTTTASTVPDGLGNYAWTISGINVYDGYNYVDISDGYNYNSVSVISTNALEPVNAIYGVVVTSLGTPNNEYCNEIDFYEVDLLGASPVTIEGYLAAAGDSGSVRDAVGTTTSFTSDGAGYFSVAVDVFNGGNWIQIYDSNMNNYYVYIDGYNGQDKPKFVELTSPAHNDAIVTSGTYTISGTVDPSFNPDYMMIYVYDYSTYTTTYCSTDPNEQANYGYLPMVYISWAKTFSCDIYLNGGNNTYIEVDGADNLQGIWHYHGIYVNNTYGYGENYYKPSVSPSKPGIEEQVRTVERLKRERTMALGREQR